MFEEEYYIIYDILFKGLNSYILLVYFMYNKCLFHAGFYIATQFWFSTCVLLTVCGLFYTTLYMHLNRSVERYVQILFTAGVLYIAAGKKS